MTMTKPHRDSPAIPPPIEERAYQWLARITSGSASAEDRLALEQWLKEDVLHRQAYEEAVELWRQLGQLAGRPLPRLAEQAAPAMTLPRPVAQRPRRARRRLLAACAALLSALAVIPQLPFWLADYATGSGEIRAIALEDGSTMHLNTASAVSVDYTQANRSVRLLAGEAEFVVQKNPARPFVVTAGDETVRALGTAFIVRREAGTVTVTQVESRVEITAAQSDPGRKVILHPGERLQRRSGQPLPEAYAVDAGKAEAWRRGKLIFESAPLDEVIAEINRYRPGAVLLMGRKNAKLPVSGVFDLNRLDRVLAVIEQTLPVKALRVGGGVVLVY